MMTNRENLITALEGGKPERIPFTTYADFGFTQPGLSELEKLGFSQTQYTGVVKETEINVERVVSKTTWKGRESETVTLRTSLGDISQTSVNGWVQEYYLKTPRDYRVMAQIVRNTKLEADYGLFYKAEKKAGDNGITLISGGRTPMQTMLVDYTGLENFALHMADDLDEVELLQEALMDRLIETYRIIADGPGRYVSLLENLTAETWGPVQFRKYHMAAYERVLPILHRGGKKVYSHCDGKLQCIADLMACTTLDGIESFTVPPEGDMQYDEARKAWPETFIWSNISLHLYDLPDAELRAWVRKTVRQAAPDGRNFALAILEDVPAQWRVKIPVILDELASIG